jgi:hypothetical protein
VDAPVSIRAVKRWACELFGNETGTDAHYHRHADARMLPPKGDYAEKVAVVGAGVAGLTVAHDLRARLCRHRLRQRHPRGMLTLGVPHRLPRELVQREIDAILALGVDLRLDSPVGVPGRTLEDLRRQATRPLHRRGVAGQSQDRGPGTSPGAARPGVPEGQPGQRVELVPGWSIGGGNGPRRGSHRPPALEDEEAEDSGDRDVARPAARRKE